MTFDVAAGRYWTEVGQHHKAHAATWWSLEWLLREIGRSTALTEITDADVARLVARRRGDMVINVARDVKKRSSRRAKAAATPKAFKRISPARVNRSVTEPLRKIMLRARKAWGETVPEINWREHLLKEPEERKREARDDEEARMFAAMHPQYHPLMRFILRLGLRETAACLLEFDQIDWGSRTLHYLGKGRIPKTVPLPDDMRDMLWGLQAPGAARVFRYANGDPISKWGFVSAWRRARTIAQVRDLRIHDLRHTAATRTLRKSGNLKMVQQLLGHRDIATTARYAHVFDEDLRAALNAMNETRAPDAPRPIGKTETL